MLPGSTATSTLRCSDARSPIGYICWNRCGIDWSRFPDVCITRCGWRTARSIWTITCDASLSRRRAGAASWTP